MVYIPCHLITATPRERNTTPVLLGGEAEFLACSASSAQGHWQSRAGVGSQACGSEALKTTRAHGHLIKTVLLLLRNPDPEAAQRTLDCTNVRKMGTSCSSSWWSACWRATFRMWIGSSRRLWDRKPRGVPRKPSRRARGPQPAPPRLAPCSHPHLAVVLRVQGIPGLAEEGGVLGHVGKAGDDLIKVPGGAGQRGRAEGPLPHEVVGQARTLPLSQLPRCERTEVCAELLWSLTRSEARVMGSSPKRRMNLCGLRW